METDESAKIGCLGDEGKLVQFEYIFAVGNCMPFYSALLTVTNPE